MSLWMCSKERHPLKVDKRVTSNLRYKRNGYKPNGEIAWVAICKPCAGEIAESEAYQLTSRDVKQSTSPFF